jgi:endo-1,4-beta-xylanase
MACYPVSESENTAHARAQDYGFVVDACLRNDKCPGITVWGFEDTLSWIPGVFPGEGAADLYDNYVAKPALAAVRKVLSQVCWS